MHKTVLLEEAVDLLITDPAGCYVDGTFGRGGHSRLILQRLAPAGRLLAIDRDQQAVAVAASIDDQRFDIKHAEFAQVAGLLRELGWAGQLSGLLVDLGVSSPQLDEAQRGFSFMQAGPLDMRMNQSGGMTAADWLATAEEKQLSDVFWRYGEERFSRQIARAIVQRRKQQPLENTAELAELITAALPQAVQRKLKKHPATKVFQAIRIQINDELGQVEQLLQQALDLLAVGGRLVVISFHSLEDRLVKRFMKQQAKADNLPRHIPLTVDQQRAKVRLLANGVKPGKQELADNPRARSAVLRACEKLY